MDAIANNLIETLAAGVAELRGFENDLAGNEEWQEELRRIDRKIMDLVYRMEEELGLD